MTRCWRAKGRRVTQSRCASSPSRRPAPPCPPRKLAERGCIPTLGASPEPPILGTSWTISGLGHRRTTCCRFPRLTHTQQRRPKHATRAVASVAVAFYSISRLDALRLPFFQGSPGRRAYAVTCGSFEVVGYSGGTLVLGRPRGRSQGLRLPVVVANFCKSRAAVQSVVPSFLHRSQASNLRHRACKRPKVHQAQRFRLSQRRQP